MDDCSICLEPLNEFDCHQYLKCSHSYHANCIAKLNSFTCPMCRSDIKSSLTTLQKRLICKNMKPETNVEQIFLFLYIIMNDVRNEFPSEYIMTLNK